MQLYHVSYERIKHLIPRVPQHRLPGENNAIARICFSDSIEKCINAKPNQADAIYLAQKVGFPIGVWVYSINVEDYAAKEVMHPDAVYEAGVIDAKQNHEYWLLVEPTALREQHLEVLNAEFLELGDGQFHCIQSIFLSETISDRCRRFGQWLESARKKAGMPHYTLDEIICNLAEDFKNELKDYWTSKIPELSN